MSKTGLKDPGSAKELCNAKLFLVRGFVFFLLLLAPLSAFAQDTDHRLNRLENEIETLSRAVFRGEQPPPGTVDAMTGSGNAALRADMELRLSRMEQELQRLTGKMEEQDHEFRRWQQRMEESFSAFDARLMDTQRQAAPAESGLAESGPAPLTTEDRVAGTTTVPPASIEPSAAPATLGTYTASESPAGTPDSVYESAFALLHENKYDAAEQRFSAFLADWPNHTLAPNARYWLAETFYVRGDFDSSARAFADAYQKDPKGAKGPDNLLKLALSLSASGKKDDACLTFTQFDREYPGGNGPVFARAAKEREKLGCPL